MPCIRLWMMHWLVLSLVAPVSVNSMPKYETYEIDLSNYELKHWTWKKSQKRLTHYLSFKITNDTFIPRKDLRIFRHLDWGMQPFQLYSGKIPSPIEWLLNPGNKGKKKKKQHLRLLFIAIFFCIILFGPSCSKSYINKSTWGNIE